MLLSREREKKKKKKKNQIPDRMTERRTESIGVRELRGLRLDGFGLSVEKNQIPEGVTGRIMPAAQGKKELLEALHAIAPIAFLSERKLAGITHLLPSNPLPSSLIAL